MIALAISLAHWLLISISNLGGHHCDPKQYLRKCARRRCQPRAAPYYLTRKEPWQGITLRCFSISFLVIKTFEIALLAYRQKTGRFSGGVLRLREVA
jgi:hypothetical protein